MAPNRNQQYWNHRERPRRYEQQGGKNSNAPKKGGMYVCCPKCPKVWVYADKLEDGNNLNLRCRDCKQLFPEDYVPKHLLPSLRALQEVDRAKKDKTTAPESFDISSNDDVAMDTDDLDTDHCKGRIKELQTIKAFCKDKDMDFPEESELELAKLLQQLEDAEDQKIPEAAPTSKQLHKEYQKLEREAKRSKDKASKMQLEVQLLQQRLEDAKVLADKEEKDAQDKRKAAADAFNKYSKAKNEEDAKELPQQKPEAGKDDPGVGVAEKTEGDELRKQLADPSPRVRYFAAISLGKIEAKESFGDVVGLVEENDNSDPILRHGGIMALSRVATSAELGELASHSSDAVRLAAVVALRRQESAEVSAFLNDQNMAVVLEASRAIHDVPIKSEFAALAGLIERGLDDDAVMRQIRISPPNQRHSPRRRDAKACVCRVA